MDNPNENAVPDHAERLFLAVRVSSVVYLAYTALEVFLGHSRQFTTPVLPAFMVAALWLKIPESWWFLAAGFVLCAVRHGLDGNWPAVGGLVVLGTGFGLCRRLFFPPARLFHWAFGALAAWLALMLFGLPRAETSFFPTHSKLSIASEPLSLDVLASLPQAAPPPAPTQPTLPPVLIVPMTETVRTPAPGAWQPKPQLARKLAAVYAVAPQKILDGDPSGQLVDLTVKLDELLKSPTKDEAQIEAMADRILAIADPSVKPQNGPIKP